MQEKNVKSLSLFSFIQFFENEKRYEHMPDGVYLGMMLLPETWEFYSVCQKSVFWPKCLFFFPQNQINDLSVMSSSGVQQHANSTKPESTETSEQNTSLQVQDQVSLIQTYISFYFFI